jgi:NAD(P)H-nitrite reductase large subunit
VGSGLDVTDGVLCDTRLGAGPPGVYAAGDVARWTNPRYGRRMRVEHWTNASEQGHVAVRNLLGAAGHREYAGIPYFWSDQHGLRLQFSGDATTPDEVWHHDTPADRVSHVTLYRRGERLAGALAIGRTPLFTRLRVLLTKGAPWPDAIALVEGSDAS